MQPATWKQIANDGFVEIMTCPEVTGNAPILQSPYVHPVGKTQGMRAVMMGIWRRKR